MGFIYVKSSKSDRDLNLLGLPQQIEQLGKEININKTSLNNNFDNSNASNKVNKFLNHSKGKYFNEPKTLKLKNPNKHLTNKTKNDNPTNNQNLKSMKDKLVYNLSS